jgi:predicted RecB family nuclease
MRQRYGAPPNGSRAAKALESPINLLSVIFGQIYFPTYSNGLKDIAGWLGFKWSDQDVSGNTASMGAAKRSTRLCIYRRGLIRAERLRVHFARMRGDHFGLKNP